VVEPCEGAGWIGCEVPNLIEARSGGDQQPPTVRVPGERCDPGSESPEDAGETPALPGESAPSLFGIAVPAIQRSGGEWLSPRKRYETFGPRLERSERQCGRLGASRERLEQRFERVGWSSEPSGRRSELFKRRDGRLKRRGEPSGPRYGRSPPRVERFVPRIELLVPPFQPPVRRVEPSVPRPEPSVPRGEPPVPWFEPPVRWF
jgi:hypothetical protein